MIMFIKKIKTKEGINSFDNEKIKKDIPKGYKLSVTDPIITLTANHIMIAYQCEQVPELTTKSKLKKKTKTNKK